MDGTVVLVLVCLGKNIRMKVKRNMGLIGAGEGQHVGLTSVNHPWKKLQLSSSTSRAVGPDAASFQVLSPRWNWLTYLVLKVAWRAN